MMLLGDVAPISAIARRLLMRQWHGREDLGGLCVRAYRGDERGA